MKKNSRGFTLVELLVVVTIIAVLSAIGLTVYSSAQKSGRIAKRVSDLSAIRTALESYYAQNKFYPATFTGATVVWRSECPILGIVTAVASDLVVKDTITTTNPTLVPSYMVAFPADPSMRGTTTSTTPCYAYASNGSDYKVVDTNLSTEFSQADWSSQRNLIDPARDGGAANPGTCKIDPGTTITSWAIYSTCDATSTSTCDASSCKW